MAGAPLRASGAAELLWERKKGLLVSQPQLIRTSTVAPLVGFLLHAVNWVCERLFFKVQQKPRVLLLQDSAFGHSQSTGFCLDGQGIIWLLPIATTSVFDHTATSHLFK